MVLDVSATFSKRQTVREGGNLVNMYIVNASLDGWDPMYFVNYNQNIVGFKMNATGDLTTTEQTYTGVS